METIEIKNFLTIDHAVFEIKKINILIGEQAQGKSVIAKLIYFFKKNFFSESFINNLQQLEKRELDKFFLNQFEKIFPRYVWEKQEFSIEYINGKYKASIIRYKTNNKFKIKLSYWNKFPYLYKKSSLLYDDFFNEIKRVFPNGVDINKGIDIDSNEFRKGAEILSYIKDIDKKIEQPKINDIFTKAVFVPASRSFFAYLQKNIFSFLSNDIHIDPLIKEFGSLYEHTKEFYPQALINEVINVDINKKMDDIITNIIIGNYVYEERQDWIVSNQRKINLINSSSGQEESVPMLVVLKVLSFLYEDTANFFIEEPEAHLFPTSQKHIISLIATIYNAFGHSFFITTHSPYILTAINNLIAGKDAYNKVQDNSEQLKKLFEVFDKDELISLDDVSAYTLKKGKLESIIDEENRLIGANLLDSVSDEFDNAFGVATDILYGDN